MRDYEGLCHYVAHMKQTGFKDITVSPSGLTLILAYSFIGASGDGWIQNHGTMGLKGCFRSKVPIFH